MPRYIHSTHEGILAAKRFCACAKWYYEETQEELLALARHSLSFDMYLTYYQCEAHEQCVDYLSSS